MRIDNVNGVTLNANKTISGALAFVNGKLITGANKILLPTTATVSGAGSGKYIYGNEEIFIPNAAAPSKTFDIGGANYYSPATITFSGTSSGSGSLTAYVTASDDADVANSGINSSLSVNRTWTITKSSVAGFTSYAATLNFVATDIDAGANTANFIVRKLNGSWAATNLVAANALSIQVNGMTTFGTFQAGESNTISISSNPPNTSACNGSSTSFTSTASAVPTPTSVYL